MRKYLAVPVAAAALAIAAAPANGFVDKDCSDFSSWQQAQHYFKKHGGPRHDPSHLDADHDGIACESLRGRGDGSRASSSNARQMRRRAIPPPG